MKSLIEKLPEELTRELVKQVVEKVLIQLTTEELVTSSKQLAWQLIAQVAEILQASAVAYIAYPGILCVQPGVLADQIAGWLIQILIYQPVAVLLLALVEKLLKQLFKVVADQLRKLIY